MYGTFFVMLAASGVLMMPNGHIVLYQPDGGRSEVMHYAINLWLFVALVFVIGCAMGIGKAAVYKHIPTYFPENVGSVGGLVGMLGGLGGFFLPPMFAYAKAFTGMANSTFAILFAVTAVSLLWMHLTIHRMLHTQSPHLGDDVEVPATMADARASGTREEIHA